MRRRARRYAARTAAAAADTANFATEEVAAQVDVPDETVQAELLSLEDKEPPVEAAAPPRIPQLDGLCCADPAPEPEETDLDSNRGEHAVKHDEKTIKHKTAIDDDAKASIEKLFDEVFDKFGHLFR